MTSIKENKCGYVAIVGQPNVGKSTLMNYLLGVKLSITSRKPQTTRHQILGINTVDDTQIVYVDTPGMHLGETKAMNRYLNRAAKAALYDVDLVVFMVSSLHWDKQDIAVLDAIKKLNKPTILVINKVDKIKAKAELLPHMEKLAKLYDFEKIMPLCAKDPEIVKSFERQLLDYIPEGVHQFEPDQLTDRNDRFIASEIIREKLMRGLGNELPYAITVTIDAFEEDEKLIKISAIIWVERDGQKQIVIGKKGEKLKVVSTDSRLDMETYYEKKVFLKTWVKIKKGWSDDERILNQLGYTE
jgi:GTPase